MPKSASIGRFVIIIIRSIFHYVGPERVSIIGIDIVLNVTGIN